MGQRLHRPVRKLFGCWKFCARLPRIGTEVQMYSSSKPAESLHRLNGWQGTYQDVSSARQSPRTAFVYSSWASPAKFTWQMALTNSIKLAPLRRSTNCSPNANFRKASPYQWKADDGTTVEGMLIYPPGKFEAKNLPMFTFIHGGPADADGNGSAPTGTTGLHWRRQRMAGVSSRTIAARPATGTSSCCGIVPVSSRDPAKTFWKAWTRW